MSCCRSSSRVRVRYAETDQMGVVYYANYFVWFEVGRTDLLRQSGWSYREMEHDGFSLPVVETRCEYRQAARYDDELEIRTAAQLLSPVRLRFEYQVARSTDQVVLAVGYTVHASLDTSGRPCRLPDRVRALLTDDDSGARVCADTMRNVRGSPLEATAEGSRTVGSRERQR